MLKNWKAAVIFNNDKALDDAIISKYMPIFAQQMQIFTHPWVVLTSIAFLIANVIVFAYVAIKYPIFNKMGIYGSQYNPVAVPFFFVLIHILFVKTWTGSWLFPIDTHKPSMNGQCFRTVFAYLLKQVMEYNHDGANYYGKYLEKHNASKLQIYGTIIFFTCLWIIVAIQDGSSSYMDEPAAIEYFLCTGAYFTLFGPLIISCSACYQLVIVMLRVAFLLRTCIFQWIDRYEPLQRLRVVDLATIINDKNANSNLRQIFENWFSHKIDATDSEKAAKMTHTIKIGYNPDNHPISSLNNTSESPLYSNDNPMNVSSLSFTKDLQQTTHSVANSAVTWFETSTPKLLAQRLRRDAYERYFLMGHIFNQTSEKWSLILTCTSLLSLIVFFWYIIIVFVDNGAIGSLIFWILSSCIIFLYSIGCIAYANQSMEKLDNVFQMAMPHNDTFADESDELLVMHNTDIESNNAMLHSTKSMKSMNNNNNNTENHNGIELMPIHSADNIQSHHSSSQADILSHSLALTYDETSLSDFVVIGGREEWMHFLTHSRLQWNIFGVVFTPKSLQTLILAAVTTLAIAFAPTLPQRMS